MENHIFKGKWITNDEFCDLEPLNVYHGELDTSFKAPAEHQNKHILFRRKFNLDNNFDDAKIYITADDYYKLYINGKFVQQGPTPSYPFCYNYNTFDITKHLTKGENTIAVHTFYQGLINRVWQSGDFQHGLLLDLEVDNKIILSSDESFLTDIHSAYTSMGVVGYETQFAERYNSNSEHIGFEKNCFDDSKWQKASVRKYQNYITVPQPTKDLVFETIKPKEVKTSDNKTFIDFGSSYVGYLNLVCKGNKNDKIVIRCGLELNDDGSVRYDMRSNCLYEEEWILSGEKDTLNWYDYKSFRYVELILPENCEISEISLTSRHYPFELKRQMRKEFANDQELKKVWDLCINTLKYGPQEVLQDCMEREKGFYVGDACYTGLAYMVLTGDDAVVKYLIDSSRRTTAFVPNSVICLNASKMQEAAEYPLMMISLMLWHYKIKGDKEFLKKNYKYAKYLLDYYKEHYEQDYLIRNLDIHCFVEWPPNYRDNYDAELDLGKVCKEAHIAINAYFIEAVSVVNEMAKELDLEEYRDIKPMKQSFIKAFYDEERKMFKDSEISSHSSFIASIFPLAMGLCPDNESKRIIRENIEKRGIHSVNILCAFIVLRGMCRERDLEGLRALLSDNKAWLRMIREGATTTFEAWGKDEKWNTSLFHLTFSYAALFLSDIEFNELCDLF